MSLYASVTGIKWDFTSPHIAGEIHITNSKRIIPFQLEPNTNEFDSANALWEMIDRAFDDDL